MGKTSSNKATVWCSAAWNYEYTNLPLGTAGSASTQVNYPQRPADNASFTALTYDATGALNDGTAPNAGKGDMGFCCYTMDDMRLTMNTKATVITQADPATSSSGTWKASTLNKWTCPAKFSGGWAADAAPDSGGAPPSAAYTSLNTGIKFSTDWWCSDGTYNLTTTTFGANATAS